MKIFAAGLATETNTFCPILTTKKSFMDEYYRYKGNHDTPPHAWVLPLVIFAQQCQQKGWEYCESLFAAAQPAGVIVKKDYEELRDIILKDLETTMPVNMVLLNLHGAMVAQTYDDCEGDLLLRIREIVGNEIPVGVLLDPHTHLTKTMLSKASVLVCYKEYPHIDVAECANNLFRIMANMLEQKITPYMASFDCRVINTYPTTLEPMKSFMAKLRNLEQQKDALSISVVHGFPWGDVPDIGTKVIVVTNDNSILANQLAHELGSELFELRGKTMAPFYSIDDALNIAEKSNFHPVVLADFSDNTGGGAPGDSNFILKRILERKITNVAIGVIYDPMAVEIAAAAGIGSKLPLRIGGKTSPQSGLPIDLDVEVIAIDLDLTVNFAQNTAHYGKTVALRSSGIDIIISSLRLQVYSTECFTKMGVDPESKRLLVVKSSVHFRASFEKISKTILVVSTPGALCPDFASIPYKNINRPIWPLDQITYEFLCKVDYQ